MKDSQSDRASCMRLSHEDVILEHRGKRVLLRPWQLNDAATLFILASDVRVAENAGFPMHVNTEDSQRVIQDVLSVPECYAIVLREAMDVVGCIQVFAAAGYCVYEEPVVEIGFWLGRSYWGRGIIPEAVKLLTDYCFQSNAFKCRRIIGRTSLNNNASRRVFEKCGFSLTGTGKWCVYDINKQM